MSAASNQNQPDPVSPITVSVKTASKMTSICQARVFKAIAKGDLKSFKVGKSRLIKVVDLHAWIDGYTEKAA
jgi:excisionase family DNA binding protein